MYIISRWIYVVLDIQTFCKSIPSVHLLYTISRWIYAILGIQIFWHIQTILTYNVHNFTLNLCNLYIQRIYRVHIFCKPKKSIHIICSISRWIYVVLDIQTFCKSKQSVHLLYTISRWIYTILGIQIFWHIQTILTYNVHNFTLNLCNLYIQRIYRVHIFCKPKKSVHIICSIFRWIYAI